MTQSTVLLNDNTRHRKYTGVQKFHDAGYFGERVTAATAENWNLKLYNPDGLCSDPLSINSSNGTDHAIPTASTFFQVAPKAKLVMLDGINRKISSNKGESYDKLISGGFPVIKQLGITNFFGSIITNYNAETKTWWDKDLEETKDYFKMTYAIGNDSNNVVYNPIADLDEIISVGAYTIMVSGTINPAAYSLESPKIDFSAPSYIYTNINAIKSTDSGTPRNGTSFSAPWFCGMLCLVDDFFIDKTGKPLTREKMYQFVKEHTIDIGVVGFDIKCGFGAFVLPDPSEIDIQKYRSDDMLEKFSDANKVSTWAKESVEYCLTKGYMNGKGNNRFAPQDTITREEFCCVIKRIIDDVNK